MRDILRYGVAVSLGLVALLGMSKPLLAHQLSMAFAEVWPEGRGQYRFELKLAVADLGESLGLPENETPTREQVLMGHNLLENYVYRRVSVRGETTRCTFQRKGVEVVEGPPDFARLTGSLRCEEDGPLLIDYHLFFDLDPRHELVLRYRGGVHLLKGDGRQLRLDSDESSVSGFFGAGVVHVLFGLDHVLFLLALLLLIPVDRTELARPGKMFQRAAGIVTAFTAGHSATLILASLGHISANVAWVETAIAISIGVVAIDNLRGQSGLHRPAIALSLGLLHGLGFAFMLEPLLPEGNVVVPLLLFNVGVEAAQLGLVCLTLPLLAGLALVLGPDRYRSRVIAPTAACLTLIAGYWASERLPW